MEERQRLPPLVAAIVGDDDAVQGRDPAVVGPARHQVADVDDERAGTRRNLVQAPVAAKNLQAARARLRQQDRQRAVIGVRAGADLARRGRRLQRADS